MVILIKNGLGNTSSNQGMNPVVLPQAMGKIVGKTVPVSLGWATSLGEGKLNWNLLNSA